MIRLGMRPVALVVLVVAALTVGGLIAVNKFPPTDFTFASGYESEQPHTKEFAVVFVHGVFGAGDTWRNNANTFPALLSGDPEFIDAVDPFVFEYHSPYFGSAGSLSDLVEQLRGALDTAGVLERHQKIVFLGHSMGGLVVTRYLLRYPRVVDNVPFIFMFASPGHGSSLSRVATVISSNPQLRALLPSRDNDLLDSLPKDWAVLRKANDFATYCAYELQDTAGVRVVSKESATVLCDEAEPMDADHVEIVKPPSRKDPRYARFASALKRAIVAADPMRGRVTEYSAGAVQSLVATIPGGADEFLAPAAAIKFGGRIDLDGAGALFDQPEVARQVAESSELSIRIEDSMTARDLGKPFPMELGAQRGATVSGEISKERHAVIRFRDPFRAVVLEGTFDERRFSGKVSFSSANRPLVSLGKFSIPTCRFFTCSP